MSNIYLRVKIKSLAAEARIIRLEERRAKARWVRLRERAKGSDDPDLAASSLSSGQLFFGLQRHRKQDVRQAARSSQLAYGFIRGRPYPTIERSCYEAPRWVEVARMVRRYEQRATGQPDSETVARLLEWSKEAA